MDEVLRLQYLKAMGIAVWVSRNGPEPYADPSVTAVDAAPATIPDREPDNQDADWTALEKAVAGCRRCSLCETRIQTVFGSGSRQADWMLIGEAPGQNEDQEGLPFVGKAGQLLTEMLRALGLSRELVYIANVLKCRPPGNRDPKAEEVNACGGYLHRQIELVQPKIILAVGRIAAQNLLESQAPLAKLRSVVHKLDNIPLIVIYHPAYLLRSPLEKRKAWEDLQFAMTIYEDVKKFNAPVI